MKMPFGKHRDVELEKVPRHYLQWLMRQEWLGGWLRDAVERTLSGDTTPEMPPQDVGDVTIPRRRSEQPTGEYSIEVGLGAWSIFDPMGEEIAWTTEEKVAQIVCKILNENKEVLRRQNEKDD